MNEWKAHLHLQDRECHCSSQRKGAARAGGAEFRSVQTVYTVYRILYTQLTSALLLTIGIA